ncbi:hypothetical protein B0T10DRAFT_499966 [Thelonectria olida]|uniref:Uncharacterized protein n=1 Tax=Thelonectria olida TaxID=1576542 RepID=A0A9P9AF83_9HYPO|nr:hypothetical protein B0T10DRAFT_499966 [Thelonectria olida]
MSHRDTKPLFVIHPRLDAGEYRDKLIGSVVKYPDMPTEGYIPYKSAKQPKNMVSNLDPKPIQVRNTKFWTHRIKDTEVSSSLNDIIEGFFGGSNITRATLARLRHMDSPSKKFKELLKNKTYFKQLSSLLKSSQDQEGYFVTDIVTLVDVAEESRKSHGTGAGAQALVDPSLGIQVGAIAQNQVGREKWYSGYYEGETIVFLGYRRVRLEKTTSIMAELGRIFLGRAHGFTVWDGLDYWPPTIGKPAEGNREALLGDTSGRNAKGEEQPVPPPDEYAEIIRELGFDVEIVE